MSNSEDLSAEMAVKTDRELQDMFAAPADWPSEALEAAGAELQKRGMVPNGTSDLPSSLSQSDVQANAGLRSTAAREEILLVIEGVFRPVGTAAKKVEAEDGDLVFTDERIVFLPYGRAPISEFTLGDTAQDYLIAGLALGPLLRDHHIKKNLFEAANRARGAAEKRRKALYGATLEERIETLRGQSYPRQDSGSQPKIGGNQQLPGFAQITLWPDTEAFLIGAEPLKKQVARLGRKLSDVEQWPQTGSPSTHYDDGHGLALPFPSPRRLLEAIRDSSGRGIDNWLDYAISNPRYRLAILEVISACDEATRRDTFAQIPSLPERFRSALCNTIPAFTRGMGGYLSELIGAGAVGVVGLALFGTIVIITLRYGFPVWEHDKHWVGLLILASFGFTFSFLGSHLGIPVLKKVSQRRRFASDLRKVLCPLAE